MAFEAVTQADAVILCPDLDSNERLEIGDYVRRAKGKRVLVGAVTASAEESLARAVESCAAQFGSITVLANNNFVAPLPPNRFYQSTGNLQGFKNLEGLFERDLADWSSPESWDAGKLSVFLREAITRNV
jgi:NAD(P)-dependent dehydrogenase (short-subunit alcohol dehydrogenase family)